MLSHASNGQRLATCQARVSFQSFAVARFLSVKWAHTLKAKRFVRHSFVTAPARFVWLLKPTYPLRQFRETRFPVDIVQQLLFHLLLPMALIVTHPHTCIYIHTCIHSLRFGWSNRAIPVLSLILIAHKIDVLSAADFCGKLFYCVLSFIIIYLLDFVVVYFYFYFISRYLHSLLVCSWTFACVAVHKPYGATMVGTEAKICAKGHFIVAIYPLKVKLSTWLHMYYCTYI